MKSWNKKLKEASGNIKSKNKLVCFLYLLMRDSITPGSIEGIIMQLKQSLPDTEYEYSNGYLAEYAQYVADELTGGGI